MGSDNLQWLDFLAEDDFTFIKRFILASGSLKELAKVYGVSYPTIRLRLDRLIEKIKILENQKNLGGFEQRLRMAYAEGKIEMEILRELLAIHKKEMEERHD